MPDAQDTSKPDFRNGFALRDLPDGGTVSGRVDSEDAILVRRGDRLFAVGAHCTHYHGPLADGLVVGDTVRCPWHHACFSLRTGEALRAPALDAISCWRVERVGDAAYVREKLGEPAVRRGSERRTCGESSPGGSDERRSVDHRPTFILTIVPQRLAVIVSGSVRIIDPVGLVTKFPGKKSCASPLEEPATLDYFSRDYVNRVHHQLRQIDALGLGDA